MTSKNSPDFFIVGAPRAGTTSLHRYLDQISDVFMCPKGSGFFSEFATGRVKTIQEYKKLFEKAFENQLIGDATPMYLSDPTTPKKIHESNPYAKIIILLRDPIERSFSHYLSFIRNGYEKESFSKQLQRYFEIKSQQGTFHDYVIMPSFYYDSISRYFEIFGEKQVKIWLYEEFSNDVEKIVKEIMNFLDIDSELPKNVGKKYNEYAQLPNNIQKSIIQNQLISGMAKKFLPKSTRLTFCNMLNKNNLKPVLQESEIKKLHKIFVEDAEKIQKLLKRNLNWNNFVETK